MKVIKPPHDFRSQVDFTVFLAGSIEMGVAWDWQTYTESKLKSENITFFNPRRDDWDFSWEQSIDNENFVEQVNWELDALEEANAILMYFDPQTKSPISLLELGAFSKDNKLLVACPSGFWKRGNVEIFCERNNIWFDGSVDALYNAIRKVVEIKNAWTLS